MMPRYTADKMLMELLEKNILEMIKIIQKQ